MLTSCDPGPLAMSFFLFYTGKSRDILTKPLRLWITQREKKLDDKNHSFADSRTLIS
jgi:hypothetical protein